MNCKNIKLQSKLGSTAVRDDEFFGSEDELKSLIEKVNCRKNVRVVVRSEVRKVQEIIITPKEKNPHPNGFLNWLKIFIKTSTILSLLKRIRDWWSNEYGE
jgi:hypothetical protein